MTWYKQKLEDVYKTLDTSENGLTSEGIPKRVEKYGLNQVAVAKDSIWKVIIEPFKNVFVGVLAVAALVSFISGEPIEATVVLVIIIINSGIFYSQHYATTRVLRNLKKQSIQKVTVMRDGLQSTIEAEQLVPGDVLYVSEGEKIPADARIISTESLQINEASLTGESIPVSKLVSVLESNKQLYEQSNMLFQGTYVVSGKARALVVETGSQTEFGRIAQLATEKPSKSPVEKKIDQLINIMIKTIAVVVVAAFLLSLARDIPASEALRFVLSMSVSAVPEGLPVALTVIIVLGMRRMAKYNVLVRSFKAIEDIGLVTTIATDKTGTLTKNHLSIIDSWEFGDHDIKQLAAHTLDSQNKLTDPLDIAIEEGLRGDAPEVDKVYPFELSLRMSGAYSKKDRMLYIKGSPEHMLVKANISKTDHRVAESSMHELAAKGYRVIAVGRLKVSGQPPESLHDVVDKTIELTGFLAFADELREETPAAIHKAQQAGISVRLITGDHFETAYNIGKNLKIANSIDQVTKGEDLPKDKHALALYIKNKTVFARILPEDKFRILQALKTSEITAMTGDGVNDVPALANAHVGIAMGSGSDIARDAGGMVLLDDNFKSIIQAISEGRKIFDNIRKMLFYLLATSVGEVITLIGALLIGLPLPLAAIQILWINLVTDTVMVIPLGVEPAEDGHMKRPPRRPKDPLLDKVIIVRFILVGLTMAVTSLIIVGILNAQGYSQTYIQTIILMALVAAQWMNAFNARSETQSSFKRLKVRNNSLLIGFAVAFILQMLVMFGPLAELFHIESVDLGILVLSSLATSLAVLGVSEAHKWVVSKKA